MPISDVRAWCEEVVMGMEKNPLDTDHTRQKANRAFSEGHLGRAVGGNSEVARYTVHGMGKSHSVRGAMVDMAGLSPAQKQKVKDVAVLLDEWQHYFDKGIISPHRIDDLPGLVKNACIDALGVL